MTTTTPTPAAMPNRSSSPAGLASFLGTQVPFDAPAVRPQPRGHEHAWLPVLTVRESTGHNCYVERKTYRCVCGEQIQ